MAPRPCGEEIGELGACLQQLIEGTDLAGHGRGREIVHALEGDVDAQVALAGQRVGNLEGDARLHRLEPLVEVVDVDVERLALAHLIFNLTTGIIAIVFISLLAKAVDAISGFVGIAADNFTLKFAVFHTLFNLIGVAIMTPLITYLVGLLGRLVPDKALDISMPRYLNEAALEFPDTAGQQEAEHTKHSSCGKQQVVVDPVTTKACPREGRRGPQERPRRHRPEPAAHAR